MLCRPLLLGGVISGYFLSTISQFHKNSGHNELQLTADHLSRHKQCAFYALAINDESRLIGLSGNDVMLAGSFAQRESADSSEDTAAR